MRVLLDEQVLDVAEPTIATALAAARDQAERKGRVIVEATLDGVPIPTEQLEAVPSSPASGGASVQGEVRFVSAEPRALVKVTWHDVAEALRQAEQDQAKAAELLQMGKLEQAMGHLASSLGVWENVRQAVLNGAALVGIDLEAVVIEKDSPQGERAGGASMSVGERVAGLAGQLQHVKRHIQSQDWSSLADTLEYELTDEARLWQRVLTQMAEAIPPAE